MIQENDLKQAKGFILNSIWLDWLNGNVNKTGLLKTAKEVLRRNKEIGIDTEYKLSDLNDLFNAYAYLKNNGFKINLYN